MKKLVGMFTLHILQDGLCVADILKILKLLHGFDFSSVEYRKITQCNVNKGNRDGGICQTKGVFDD